MLYVMYVMFKRISRKALQNMFKLEQLFFCVEKT